MNGPAFLLPCARQLATLDQSQAIRVRCRQQQPSKGRHPMSDAYYPEHDAGIMESTPRASTPRGPFPDRVLTEAQSLAYRNACAANGIKFTEHDGDAVTKAATRARHCDQARAGYYYCASTVNDPCGPEEHPHTYCTAGACIAGTPEALALAADTRAYLLGLARGQS